MNQNPEQFKQDKTYAGFHQYYSTTQAKNNINYITTTNLEIGEYQNKIRSLVGVLVYDSKFEWLGKCRSHRERLAITEFSISEILASQKQQPIKP